MTQSDRSKAQSFSRRRPLARSKSRVAAVFQGTNLTARTAARMEDLEDIHTQDHIVGFEECREAHPRFQYEDFPIPQWLKDFEVVSFDGDDLTMVKAVHKLYHIVLDNIIDRNHMASALAVGMTFAIVRPSPMGSPTGDKQIAVAAITFAAIGGKVLVLYIGIDPKYQNSGFGSQLLKMMGVFLRCGAEEDPEQDDKQVFSVFLFANEMQNQKAWKFYQRRGFEPAPPLLSESIQEFIDDAQLKEFVFQDSEDLKLLCLQDIDSMNFGYASLAKVPICFLLDPERPMHGKVEDPMVYALFPGTLSLADWNHCGDQLLLYQQLHVFQEHNTGPVGVFKGYPKSQFVVSWSSRTEIKTGQTILNPAISMLLAWIQRDGEASIWKNRVTLIPTCVMMPLWNMHFLLQRYLQSLLYIDEEFADMKRATFHPEFDNERFMECATIIMKYIWANREELFAKPYIVMFGEDLNMDWTCFLSVNAGTIDSVGEKYKGGQMVCGFMLFDPMADDGVFQNRPINGDDPYLFFLTLARHVLKTVETQPGEAFDDISKFVEFFNQAEFSFGERYQESFNDRNDFHGDPRFVQLAIPIDYPVRLHEDVVHYSKFASIIFFIDFCVSVAEKDFRWGPCSTGGGLNAKKPLSNKMKYTFVVSREDYGFGKSLDGYVRVSKNKKKTKKDNRDLYAMSTQRVMNNMFNDLVVLIDRIACTGYGEGRTSRDEYKKFLKSRSSSSDPSAIPTALYSRFTDRAHAMEWKPREPEAEAANTDQSAPVELTGVSALLEAASQSLPMQVLLKEDGKSGGVPLLLEEVQADPQGQDLDPPLPGEGQAEGQDIDSRLPEELGANLDAQDIDLSLLDAEVGANLDDNNFPLPDGDIQANDEVDPRLSQLEDGQLVPLELDLLYEGFEEGHGETRPINAINDKHSICPMGALPALSPKPPELNASSKKKTYPNKKRLWSSKDFVAVGPMSDSAKKRARATRGRISEDVEVAVVEHAESICVGGDLCCRPGGSTMLDDLGKCASCSRCKSIGHCICLRTRKNQRLCPQCFQIVRMEAAEKARADLIARRERQFPQYLEPPAELLPFENFVRPNISSRMRDTLDHELALRDFLPASEMRDKILAHNSKIKEFRDDPNKFNRAERIALEKEDVSNGRLFLEWKKCYRKLRHAYVRDTRCCVKELRYCSKKVRFEARMEWEESATNTETGEDITVLYSEEMVVKDDWVKTNFTRGTYDYLKMISRRAKGKFMPVPNAHVILDTRQVSHFKWTISPAYPDGRWIVRFANSDETEEMKEADLQDAVGLPAMTMAKTFASGKGGFIPIPVGNSTGVRAVDVVSDIEIAFQQHDRQTCIYSSFASALWFIGITDVALLVVSEAGKSQGDPFALQRLAKLVYDHPTWLTPRKIKRAATSFNLLQHDLTNSLAVVVLKGLPDGACNHAITVFDGMIFDSNEQFAIPLTRANLDLMCSTDTRKATYQCVTAGYIFIDPRKEQAGIRDSQMQKVVSDIEIAFQQHDRETCIYSSFASALWFIGITDVALLVVSEAGKSQGDPFAIKRLAKLVHEHPTWLTPRKIKRAATSFKLLQHDLTNSLAVVVLKGIPDGACNHAITVFDGMIFDSNEKFAIPLTRANLDLMCSTDTRKAKYECVTAGYIFMDSRKAQTGIRDSKMKKHGCIK